MPEFTEGTTYQFEQPKLFRGLYQERCFFRVYLRHVGKLDLFKSPTCAWKESFTREQLADFTIQEVRK